jgi:uncharacterized protein YukE
MPKAIVDPDDLHRFAVELKRFSGSVSEQTSRINRQFKKLGETWQDQEQAKFAGEFTHMVSVLSKFIQAAEEQTPVLFRKAEAIRRYLEQS